MERIKKPICILLSLILILSVFTIIPAPVQAAEVCTDVLTVDDTGATRTNYVNWTAQNGVDHPTIASEAVYSGNSAKGNGGIQLRSKSQSGVVTVGSDVIINRYFNCDDDGNISSIIPGVVNDNSIRGCTLTPKIIVGHSITLNGSIGVNFYLDLTDEEAQTATVDFGWTVEGKEKTASSAFVKDDQTGYYVVSCPIAVAEMTYDVTATLTVGGETYTDTYSAVQYADVILTDASFKTKFIAEKGEDKFDQLVLLVKSMLDYGAKAQTQFHRNEEDLADAKLTNDDDTSLYYYDPDAVDAGAISTGASDMTNGLPEGLVYKGTTIVYLTETSMRHYYQGDLDDAAVTFDGKQVSPVQKGDGFYFELENIAAADLDTLYTLTINVTAYQYSVLDYVKACLLSDKTSDNMKALAAATYRYNQAANAYFGR